MDKHSGVMLCQWALEMLYSGTSFMKTPLGPVLPVLLREVSLFLGFFNVHMSNRAEQWCPFNGCVL